MFVRCLELRDFRNYELEKVEFSDGVNILSGDNAQGKTNLLEAVYLLSIGRSPRTSRDRELIRWDKDSARVLVVNSKKSGDDKVELILTKNENKRIAINGMPILKIGELMGVVNTVFFSPSELRVIKDGPSERRSFIDVALCQISKAYFYLLTRYNKILSQRNKLLKTGNFTDAALEVWDIQLSEYGSKIVKTRKGFIKSLTAFAKINHSYLTDGAESLDIAYEGLEGESKDDIRESFLKELMRSKDKDIRLGYTNTGPQKDDIRISADGVDLRTFGSQGQQRTAALSLKLAELDLYNAEFGEYPVLLLDDVLSELDLKRQEKLLKRISSVQTILTCTHIEDTLINNIKSYKHFKISDGTTLEVEK